MVKDLSTLDELGSAIIGSAFDVRNMYGRLMLESFYESVMKIELTHKGLKVECQRQISLCHKGIVIPNAYRADMIVNDSILIEFKAMPYMRGDEFRQIMTYLKLTGIRLGYLINFGAKEFKFGRFNDRDNGLKYGLYRVIV